MGRSSASKFFTLSIQKSPAPYSLGSSSILLWSSMLLTTTAYPRLLGDGADANGCSNHVGSKQSSHAHDADSSSHALVANLVQLSFTSFIGPITLSVVPIVSTCVCSILPCHASCPCHCSCLHVHSRMSRCVQGSLHQPALSQ